MFFFYPSLPISKLFYYYSKLHCPLGKKRKKDKSLSNSHFNYMIKMFGPRGATTDTLFSKNKCRLFWIFPNNWPRILIIHFFIFKKIKADYSGIIGILGRIFGKIGIYSLIGFFKLLFMIIFAINQSHKLLVKSYFVCIC